MSWNQIKPHTIEAQFEMQGDYLYLYWTCPRCYHEHHTKITATHLLVGTAISCENVAVCGKHQTYFYLDIELTHGAYKGISDRPLNS